MLQAIILPLYPSISTVCPRSSDHEYSMSKDLNKSEHIVYINTMKNIYICQEPISIALIDFLSRDINFCLSYQFISFHCQLIPQSIYPILNSLHYQFILYSIYSIVNLFHTQFIPQSIYSIINLFHRQFIPFYFYSILNLFHSQIIPYSIYFIVNLFHYQFIPLSIYSIVNRLFCGII